MRLGYRSGGVDVVYTIPRIIIQSFGRESVITGSAEKVNAYFEQIDQNQILTVKWTHEKLQVIEPIIEFN